MTTLRPSPLTADAFAPFGEVIEASGDPTMMINRGNCARFHDLSRPVALADGAVAISVFQAKPYALPLMLDMMERHPLGSQSFVPMSDDPYLVIVAADTGGIPATPQVFVTNGAQGVTYAANTWHGVLTPIAGSGLFTVIDRVGAGDNLQEHWFDTPFKVTAP